MGAFPSTRWSIVQQARSLDPTRARAALAEMCGTYERAWALGILRRTVARLGLLHVARMHLRPRKHRDTRLGHALEARIGAAFVLGLAGLATFITPSQGRYVALVLAALGAYSTWIHHWEAEAEDER